MADHIIVIDEDNENEIPPPARAYWHQPALAPRRQRDDQVNLSNAAIRERLQYSRNRGPNITIAIPENLTLLNYVHFQRFLVNIFDGWRSNEPLPEFPLLPECLFKDTHIKVGVLQEDHPFSAAQVKSGANEQKPERRPGQPVLGLADKKNAGFSPRYARLDDGHDSVTIHLDLGPKSKKRTAEHGEGLSAKRMKAKQPGNKAFCTISVTGKSGLSVKWKDETSSFADLDQVQLIDYPSI
ncbi:unnamed protein product [Fusarium venenatum]|uniref:Uncharacterized protein n=1 Tax=Fusarium venenatum TaxID=56646 RepID=A0A2L2T053_9HYPO|nr:uncharacterized protein FVRRES_07274 [Fusarium venenatum]CEI62838.1 unnamed protein product [Fusarium venenatum]